MKDGRIVEKNIDKIFEYCKKYGFFYPSCEIYGGKAGFYDYGSIGTILKRKFENLWRKYFGKLFDNIWEIEPTEIMLEDVFKASGHLELFNDPITECKSGHRFRADKLIEEKLGIKAESLSVEQMNKIFKEGKITCPECGEKLGEVRLFNLMFPIFVGPESGNLFMYLKEIYEKYYNRKKIFYLVKEKIEKKKPTYKTEDGLEFISILKNVFKERIKYFEDEGYFYIFDENMKNIVRLNLFTREAEFFLEENINLEEIIEKHKDIDIEKEFENILNNAESLMIDEVDLENYLLPLMKTYEEVLKNRMFLRPETAQGPYVNFPQEIIIHRNKLPIGLMVIGRAYRNEISPRNLLLRMREFTQAELQIFFDLYDNPFEEYYEKVKDKKINVLLVEDREKTNKFIQRSLEELNKEKNLPKFYLYFMYKIQEFYLKILRIPEERFRFFELSKEEKAFYNLYHFDIELFLDELGWIEVGGIHFRAIEISKEDLEKIKDKKVKELLEKIIEGRDKVLVGYDLYKHLLLSGNPSFLVSKSDGTKILPVELELSFGIDRNIFSLIWIFYDKENLGKEIREVLRIPEFLAPIEVAVFPLLENREELVRKAKEVYNLLKDEFITIYDDSGSIGKRYRRQDAIGTPFCITIDYKTLEDNTVTVRFRDTMKQERVSIQNLVNYLKDKLKYI